MVWMKASEAIAKLQNLIQLHGDCEIGRDIYFCEGGPIIPMTHGITQSRDADGNVIFLIV